ncbi:hypothetical protein BLNAU_7022 [Blattamonas nauphoetae]|uniref:Transmembrane protein n=1 Tax=Blattamonas nauphoetae TaxID=2049346 RepID=A0ABQ9Y2X1_9EUKA|nr:hypothetical protein BLNAU_7022 [Blattamonas nauphoetae]
MMGNADGGIKSQRTPSTEQSHKPPKPSRSAVEGVFSSMDESDRRAVLEWMADGDDDEDDETVQFDQLEREITRFVRDTTNLKYLIRNGADSVTSLGFQICIELNFYFDIIKTVVVAVTLYMKFFQLFPEQHVLWRKISSPIEYGFWKKGKSARICLPNIFINMIILQIMWIIPNYIGIDVKWSEIILLSVYSVFILIEIIWAQVITGMLEKYNVEKYYMYRYLRTSGQDEMFSKLLLNN